jgi:hypothetical protein
MVVKGAAKQAGKLGSQDTIEGTKIYPHAKATDWSIPGIGQ